MLDKKLLNLLACPICKGPVRYHSKEDEIWCKADQIAFPVRDGIPVMLEEEGRKLTAEELLSKPR